MHPSLPTCLAIFAALSQTATAFYPYSFDTDSPSSSSHKRLSNPIQPATNSITLPLRRVASPLRPRQNAYNIVNSKDPTQANSVAIDQDGADLSYMVAVTIGTSKEEYHLLLDSAASNTWVMSSDCATESCKTHSTFGADDSSTLKQDTTTPFHLTYGTGSASGNLATDTLTIGPFSPALTFGLATNVSQEFRSYPMDGILGIGRGTTTTTGINSPSLLSILSSASLIQSQIYGIHIPRSSTNLLDGELTIGTLNPSRFTGAINYMPCLANPAGFWEIPLTDATVDGKNLAFTAKSAIIDTGTSYMLIPPLDAAAIHALIPGSTQHGETFYVPCDTIATISLVFNNTKYQISTMDWRGGKVQDQGGLCRSNIVGRQTFGEGQWLVGDVFLKGVYTVFDAGEEGGRVGFGVLHQEEASSAAASTTPSAVVAGSSAGAATTTTQSQSQSQSQTQATNPGEATAQGQTGSAGAGPGRGSRIALSSLLSSVWISWFFVAYSIA